MIGRSRLPVRHRWNVQYMQRVLATNPIAYWMQDEKQGLVSYDMVTARSDGARNGQYTGPTLGQPGIGDGRTMPFFDGINDFNNALTASFSGVFNGLEGSALIWFRPAVGAMADGIVRYCIRIEVDVNNHIEIRKQAAANTIRWLYRAAGVAETNSAVLTDAQHSVGITWSASAGGTGEVRYYADGVSAGATDVTLGAWLANPLTVVVIGASTLVPGSPWHGDLGHIPIWDRPLSPAEMLSVGVL